MQLPHSLIHDIRRYDQSNQSKIDDVCDLAKTMPTPLHSGYVLVDSWYTCPKFMNAFAEREYSTQQGMQISNYKLMYQTGFENNKLRILLRKSGILSFQTI
ncbi:hypothetical protein LSG31_06995 [Fodinisporobacter ferrooxydans]|uniref:Transposase IS701-like DDE domain-containing protein n=1 Tax=Fodinisporobacter ferrooxydans TaxID=2901836 RepID=A0ABY4CNB1_9BACL|nr:hypothetical protein LSG31_06995 [Alicyclobacillaceae bacterium MYW30-H2]